MNSIEITRYLTNNATTRKFFVGCFPIDLLPRRINTKTLQIIVINTADSSHRGLHWFCMAIYPTSKHVDHRQRHIFQHLDTIIIYDSCATNIFKTNYYIKEFLEKNKRYSILYNRNVTQDNVTDLCGEHVIVVAYLLAKGFAFEQILTIFAKHNLKFNDKIILYLFAKCFVVKSFNRSKFKGIARY